MWKLNEIYAQNICAFRELSYSIVQHKTTLIFGDNRDNESQRSNGSGKSALIECIALGLTGSPLRKIRNEEIINDQSEECFVELVLENEYLKEVFTIQRRLFRKGSALVTCRIERDGRLVETDEAVQSSVDGYNRYILHKLGIDKEELFNTFILSKYKYENFLSCSDREKKEIINRFSNAVLVDEAIEKILEDKVPFEKRLKEYDMLVAESEGRMRVYMEQIREAEDELECNRRSRQENIRQMKKLIEEKRGHLYASCEDVKLQRDLLEIEDIDKQLQQLENAELTVEEAVKIVPEVLGRWGKERLTDWKVILQEKRQEMESWKIESDRLAKELQSKIEEEEDLKADYDALMQEYKDATTDFSLNWEKLDEEEEHQKQRLKEMDHRVAVLKNKRRSTLVHIEDIEKKLAGSIICPKCEEVFILADHSFDVVKEREELRKKKACLDEIAPLLDGALYDLKETQEALTYIDKRRTQFQARRSEWNKRSLALQKSASERAVEINRMKQERRLFMDSLSSFQAEMGNYRRRVFDEAFDCIDFAYKQQERKTQLWKEEMAAIRSSIETLEENLKELESCSDEEVLRKLRENLKECHLESGRLYDSRKRIEQELVKLREQEENFTAFKTYLANTKIEALSKITNEFLENIGSDIRINFSGYTFLKSGKIREKISVSLIRGGVDCGSFGKFSAGEAARVNLATILAMQKLVNTNCEDGKGLDLLVLDEILEAVDEQGLAMMFDALNKIGVTALIVSHGNIAESYPYVLKIVKEHGESRIG